MPPLDASGSHNANSASNTPVFQVQRIDNGQMRFIAADGSAGMADTRFIGSASALDGFPAGPVRVRVWVNGVPSGERSTTLALRPGAPLTPVATGGPLQAHVDFAPADNGGAPIAAYTATASPGGAQASCTAPCTRISFTTLPTGSYTFSLHGTNAVGTGPESAASNTVTVGMASPGLVLASNSATSTLGETVSFTATLSPSVGAGGSVDFMAGSTRLCTSTLISGQAHCAVSGLGVGTYTVVAIYSGDAGHGPATSNSLSQAVGAARVPLPGSAGSATVDIQGPAGCVIAAPRFSATLPAGTPAPANATYPLGIFSFTASGAGCTGAALAVTIGYPAGSLGGLQARKFGPSGPGVAPAWFDHGTMAGDSVTYTVTDNGVGDNDATAGRIADPFAPLLVASPAAKAIPTLNDWGLALVSALLALGGLGRLGRIRRQRA
jgi:hypothetical protein